jgi:hypothetical protein
MERLTNWTARRAGGRITITGTDNTGHQVKITNVDTIESRHADAPHPVATDKSGERYVLA